MKIYTVLSILALACACTTSPIQAAPERTTASATGAISDSDFDGGYFVARSNAGNSHTVEMKFRLERPNNFLVLSYREATMDSGPSKACIGNANLTGNILTSDVVCGQNEYVFQVDVGGAKSADLSTGVLVKVRSGMSGPWLSYGLKKQSTPYFN